MRGNYNQTTCDWSLLLLFGFNQFLWLRFHLLNGSVIPFLLEVPIGLRLNLIRVIIYPFRLPFVFPTARRPFAIAVLIEIQAHIIGVGLEVLEEGSLLRGGQFAYHFVLAIE